MKKGVILAVIGVAVFIFLPLGAKYAGEAYQRSEFAKTFGVDLPTDMTESQFSTLQARVTSQLGDDNRQLKMAEWEKCGADDAACIDKKVKAVADAAEILRHDTGVAKENNFLPDLPPICADGASPAGPDGDSRCGDGSRPQ